MYLQTPLVSIFICTYNQEKYIEETLDSFIMQDCNFNYEIVIAEDNSSDQTLEICREYKRKYRGKINILSRQKNLGLIENFFRGITKCKGKYIAMCGGDDYWTDKTKLQKQVDFLESNDDYVITYTDSVMKTNSGDIISNSEVGAENLRDFSKLELQKGAFISPRTMLFRNILNFNKINYSGIFQEDAFLISLLGEYGKGKFLKDIEPSIYRILKNGIWSSQTEIERLFSSKSTFKRLIFVHKDKPEVNRYYKDLIHHNMSRALYLSISNKKTKYVIKSYLISLTLKQNWLTLNLFLNINKDFFSYFLNHKYR
jgi:glycosyltransferase involved in cell wall biosynthesis